MGSKKGFVRGQDGSIRIKNTVSWLTSGAASDPEKPDIGVVRPFPRRLRRKPGLCYTADANSPFEAYINVR